MADLEDKNRNSSQTATTVAGTPAQPEKTKEKFSAEECHLKELHDDRFEKKGARRAFHAVNFLGLHQIFNNVASVIITYKMATTGLASKMKEGMAHGPIGKVLSTVLSAPNKVVNGAFKLFGKDVHKGLTEKELGALAHKSQRQAIETAFMCVAGFIALAPVYFLEKHRAGFLNTVDNWLHPGRSKKEKKAAALTPEDEPKETLWNLVRARLVALAVVFGVDQARDNIDNILKHKYNNAQKTTDVVHNTLSSSAKSAVKTGKIRGWYEEITLKNRGVYKNVDTVFGWGLGDFIYKRTPAKVRGWLARLFSGSLEGKNVTLGSIQDETIRDVLKVIKAPDEVVKIGEEIAKLGEKKRLSFNDKNMQKHLEGEIAKLDKHLVEKGHFSTVERAVFSEQSRLFITKEVFLTTILSAVIYFCAKSPTALKFMEKIGMAKKGTYEKEHAALEARKKKSAAPHHEETEKSGEETKFAASVGKRKPLAEPSATFTEAAAQSQNQEATVSLG